MRWGGRGGVRWLLPALTLAAFRLLRAACGVVVQAHPWTSGARVNAGKAFAAWLAPGARCLAGWVGLQGLGLEGGRLDVAG